MASEKRPITEYVTYLLAQAHRALHLQLEERLRAEGVHVEHWRILEILSDKKGRSMGELADLVLMNHPALTKMLDRMVANGLVHRTTDPADQRRVLVFVTDRGMDLFERIQAQVVDHDGAIANAFGKRKTNSLKTLLEELISTTR